MKIATVVGARPQFIKAAMVSRLLRKYHKEVLIHTGQHYDRNMSGVFFDELDIPEPDHNLGVSGGSHGAMTGNMMIKMEEILLKEDPDAVLVYGDTNSTLAGALSAVKLHIPVIHVESGGRLGTLQNPEEVNRVLTDRISSVLFCCTASAVNFLKKEGIEDGVHLVGDPMYDAFLYYKKKIGETPLEILQDLWGKERKIPQSYYYLTCHREENAGSAENLLEILMAMEGLDVPTVYPVHPRNRKLVMELARKHNLENIIFCAPVGYLMSIYLVNHARKVVTDSGGVQREAFFAEKQCVTVFDHVVWPETMTEKRNQLAKPCRNDIIEKLEESISFDSTDRPFGDGKSAEKMVQVLNQMDSK
jgi:UDP-N-acetylglucosamine 2-epimerase